MGFQYEHMRALHHPCILLPDVPPLVWLGLVCKMMPQLYARKNV